MVAAISAKDGHSRRIGRCIYCGASAPPLSNEHVIPLGLDGNVTLGEASCTKCARITSDFERGLLRDLWGGFRSWKGMRSRRKEKRSLALPILVRRGSKWSTELVPVDEHPTPAALPYLTPPAHLTGAQYARGVTLAGPQIGALMPKEDLEPLARKLRADGLRLVQLFKPVDFARLIAKVGYGTAVLLLGYDAFDQRYVIPAILGQRDDVGRWVGGSPGAPVNQAGQLHEVTVLVVDGEVHAYVRLFAGAAGGGPPEYVVVVGTVRPDWKPPPAA